MSRIGSVKTQWHKLPESERLAIVLAIGILVTAFLLAALLNLVGVGESAAFIAIIIIPLIVYGVVSGKVQEFSAPGGWGAKFREAANNEVEPFPIIEAAMASISQKQLRPMSRHSQ